MATSSEWMVPVFPDTEGDARKVLLGKILEEIKKLKAEPDVPGETKQLLIPWHRTPDWDKFAKTYKVGSRTLNFFRLNHDISAATGYGCFDVPKGCAVLLQTEDEQRIEATKTIVKFVRGGILHIKHGHWDVYPGLTGSDAVGGVFDPDDFADKARLRRNFPKGYPAVDPSEVVAAVLADKDVGPRWIIDPLENYAACPE